MAVTQAKGLNSRELRNRAAHLIQQSQNALRDAQEQIARAKQLSNRAEILLTVSDITEKGGVR